MQPGMQPPPYARPSNSTATTALVCSIIGIMCCGVLSIVRLVLASSAKREIEASGGAVGGEGEAKAAWIIGWISIGIWVLAGFARVIAIFLSLS